MVAFSVMILLDFCILIYSNEMSVVHSVVHLLNYRLAWPFKSMWNYFTPEILSRFQISVCITKFGLARQMTVLKFIISCE